MDTKLKRKRAAVVAAAAVLLMALGVVYILYGKELLEFFGDTERFKTWLLSFGAGGRVIFTAIRAAQTVVKFIPAEPLEIGAGCAFGSIEGMLWCMLGTQIGSLVILALSKRFGMAFTRLFVPEKKLDSFSFLNNNARLRSLLFIIYLIPGTPKDLITYFAWLMPINPAEFLLLTGIARIPSILTSTLCGNQLINGNYLDAALIFGATTLAGIVGVAVYRRIEVKRAAALPVAKSAA